jgi:sirohydrochlorin cobaltochelatase
MPDPIERALAAALADTCRFGQVLVQKGGKGGFVLCHRDDKGLDGLKTLQRPDDVLDIAKFDDAGNYRPLKTAPNLRHGWRLVVVDLAELRRALDYFYPGRLPVFGAWKQGHLETTPLRATLERQSGMYRIAANISDDQIDDLVGNFCRSDGGCLRTILWKRDATGRAPSTKLPSEKYDPAHDQTRRDKDAVPLLCQEACNLLVAAARQAVKGE